MGSMPCHLGVMKIHHDRGELASRQNTFSTGPHPVPPLLGNNLADNKVHLAETKTAHFHHDHPMQLVFRRLYQGLDFF